MTEVHETGIRLEGQDLIDYFLDDDFWWVELDWNGIVEADPEALFKVNSGEIPYEPEALTLDFCNSPGVENVEHKFFTPHIHVITFTYRNRAYLFTIWDFSHARFYEAKRWPLEPWYE